MPDLMTHLCVTHLARRGMEARRGAALPEADAVLFYLGGCLPDLVSRAPGVLAHSSVAQHVLLAMHQPVPVLLSAYIIALCLPETGRRRYFAWIIAGAVLHYSLDLLQRDLGAAGEFWLFPFSWSTLQLGFFWPDQAVLAIAPLLMVIAWVEWRRLPTRSTTTRVRDIAAPADSLWRLRLNHFFNKNL